MNKGDDGSVEGPAEVETGTGAGVVTLPEPLMVLATSYVRCRVFTSGLWFTELSVISYAGGGTSSSSSVECLLWTAEAPSCAIMTDGVPGSG